jgi:hypothetical protein
MAQDLEARVKALEGAVQNLSDQECASHAGALRSEAMRPTENGRSRASPRKGGSTAPALQRAIAAIRSRMAYIPPLLRRSWPGYAPLCSPSLVST